jgi:hypothetical protein
VSSDHRDHLGAHCGHQKRLIIDGGGHAAAALDVFESSSKHQLW